MKLKKKAKKEKGYLSQMNDIIQNHMKDYVPIKSCIPKGGDSYVFNTKTGKGILHKEKDRLKYNRKIISRLSELVEENPDLRFGQILENKMYKSIEIGERLLSTEFYTESKNLYERIKKMIQRSPGQCINKGHKTQVCVVGYYASASLGWALVCTSFMKR